MEPHILEETEGNEEMVGEEILVATVATKTIFVPEFTESGCRLDALLDSEADDAVKSRALIGGKPPIRTSYTSLISKELNEEEEEIQAVSASQTHAVRGDAFHPVEEEELMSFHVDRSVNFAHLVESLSLPNTNCTRINNGITMGEMEPIEIRDASFAFSSPSSHTKPTAAACTSGVFMCNPDAENNISTLSKPSEYSGNIDAVISPPPEFASASCEVESSNNEELIKPLIVNRHRINLSICSDIPLTKIDYKPKEIETDSLSEEECIEYTEATIAHSAPPGFSEADVESVSEEEFTAVTLPAKSLHSSILNNELFTFISTEYRRPERVITESDEEDVTGSDDQKIAPSFQGTLETAAEGDVIVPQRRVSTKYTAGMAVKSSEPPSPLTTQHVTGNNASLTAPPPGDTKSSPKVKKGFLGLFKRSPKPTRVVSADVKTSDKSKSLPRNLKSAEVMEQAGDKNSPTTTNKKSGFFSFGSRGKGKLSKSQTLEKQPPPNSNAAVSKVPEVKPVPNSGKSNIRVFEIMAENGAATPKDSIVKDKETAGKSEGPAGFESERVSAGVIQPNESVAAKSEAPDPRFTVSDPENGRQVKIPEIIVGQPAILSQNSAQQPPDPDLSKYMVVVAIDFGTAFSGYAFSFVRDPDSIHMMSRWEGGDPGIINQKTPTILLLNPEGEFHSFGFTARNHYHDLSPEDSLKWLYFDKFKMSLYKSSDCNRQTMIEAANGQKFSALEAVKITLTFFKDHALQELSDQCGMRMSNDDVRWIVTVPAIWNAAAKQFMRQAAYGAGLASPDAPDQLVVALEPEAASIHIRKLRLYHLVPEKPTATLPLSIKKLPQGPINLETVSSQFKTVTRYMVVDCGGGTIDITVHDINAVSGLLTEVYKATGGAYGSCGIDADFETLLCEIFGEDFITSYKKNRPSGWVALILAFESRKRAASPFRIRQPLNVAFPFSFIDYHRKSKGSTVEKAISDFGEPEVRWSSQGMLRISFEAMKLLFKKTADGIVQNVSEVFNKVDGIQNIFLVGGLSESPVIQQTIRDQFAHRTRIVVPQEANLAVLKGAVCFGLDPGVVVERRSKLTYGAAVLHRFIPGKHPQLKLIHRDGVDWCKDVFDQLVVVDQIVRREEPVVRSYTPASASQSHITVSIYSSEHSDVQFITDPRVRQCATVTLDLMRGTTSGGPARRKIQTFMSFADTEIKVTALDTTTGEKVDATIDFFCN